MLPQTIQWIGEADGYLRLIDQTKLPGSLSLLDCRTPEDTWHAIKRLSVRGAPAIGIAAAYGVVLALREDANNKSAAIAAVEYLATSRPTAVNLFWALDRVRDVIISFEPRADSLGAMILEEARLIHEDDRECCHRIGRFGADLLEKCDGVITHCNAGGLATSEYGTALAAIYEAHKTNARLKVFADETRPLLQGARLTAWELQQSGVDVTVICDSMAAQVMREGRAQAVIVGADRIAANGDAANKIGTYPLAIAAKYHGIPFYVAAPISTFDLSLESGDEIPIEQRAEEEISEAFGCRTVPEGVPVYNPAFDVTPASLITAIITEAGIIRNVTTEGVADICDPAKTINGD
jgi:methylthioribose-1-phosphate isomerase